MTGAAAGEEWALRVPEKNHSMNAVRQGRNYAAA